MHTKEELKSGVKSLGILPTDVITVHTSLRAVGDTEGCAEGFITALRECVPEGLLVVPTHTWGSIFKDFTYDVRETKPCIGTLPCVAVEMANHAYITGDITCRRSLHPSHSVVAFGKNALDYIKGDEVGDIAMPLHGSYGKLKDVGAKILLVGVDLTKNTFIHVIDEIKRDDVKKSVEVTVTDYEGNKIPRICTGTKGDSRFYEEYRKLLEREGVLSYGKIGDADTIVCDAKKCFDVLMDEPTLDYDGLVPKE